MPKLSEIVNARDAPATAAQASGGGLGALYSDYIGGPANDFVRNLLNQGLPGHPMNDFVAGAVAPESLTQAGLTAGTMIAPEAKAAQFFGSEARNAERFMPMVKRLLGPILGGGAGGLAEKGDPIDAAEGAALGAVTGIPAEVLGGVSRWMAKSKLAQRFYREDPKALGKVVQDLVPQFPELKTPEDFGKAVWGGLAQEKLSEMYTADLSKISRVASQVVVPKAKAASVLNPTTAMFTPMGEITSPAIRNMKAQGIIGRQSMDFDSIVQTIRDLRLKGRAADGDPKVTLVGRQARDYAAELSTEVSEALKSVSPSVAKRYDLMDRKYAKGAEMLRYLKQPGVVDENGRLDMKLLQAQLKEERRVGLTHDFAPEEMQQLTDAVFRGGPATVEDVIRKTHTGVRMHASPTGKPGIVANVLDLLKNNDYAGDFDVQGLIPPGKTALTLQRLGAGGAAALDRPISLKRDDTESD